ncbi:PQQ-binding-like beta-propeller repeat protein, partial [bacterium]|nr:PQQ-binding-like beta-propeller repeat protein [bacterium]
MHGRLPLLLALACVAATCTALAADWPQFRGPNADGIAPDTGLNKDWAQKPPKVLWRLPLGDGGYAGPSVAKGLVYVIDHEGKQDIVRALKLDTGEEAWRFAYDDTDRNNYGFSRSTPVYSDGMLYTISRMGWVHCLKADTGEKVWAKNLIADFHGKKPQWDYSMSAKIDGDRLIVMPGGDGGSLLVLNKATGEKIL